MKQTISKPDFLYGLALILATIYYTLKRTGNDVNIFMWMAFFCMLIKLIYDRYSRKTLLFIMTILLGAFVCCMRVGEMSLLITATFLFAAQNVNLKRTYRIMIWTTGICALLIVALFILENGIVAGTVRDGKLRYSMGFQHPNSLALIIYIIVELYILLHYAEKPQKTIFVASVMTVISYWMTDSRTSALLSMAIIILLILGTRFDIKRIMKPVLLLCYPLSVFCSYYGTLHHSSVPWVYFNKMISWRLSWAALALQIYSVRLYPQYISLGMTLDTGYINLLLKFGWVITAVYWLIYVVLWKEYYDQLSTETVILIIMGALYIISENIALIICYNPMFFAFSNCILGKRRQPMLRTYHKGAFMDANSWHQQEERAGGRK